MVSAIRSSALPPVYAAPISPLASSTAALTRARLRLQLVQLRSSAAATSRRLDQFLASRGFATPTPTTDRMLDFVAVHFDSDSVTGLPAGVIGVSDAVPFTFGASPAPLSSSVAAPENRSKHALLVFNEMPSSGDDLDKLFFGLHVPSAYAACLTRSSFYEIDDCLNDEKRIQIVKSSLHSNSDYSVGLVDVGSKVFKTCGVVHACESPHVLEQSVVLLENGGLFLFDLAPHLEPHWLKPHVKFKGKKYVDAIMQFPSCINLIVNLLRSESNSTCEAAAGLLRSISSVNLYRDVVGQCGAIEEITALLTRPSLAPEVKKQAICTLWNWSVDGKFRMKIGNSEVLLLLVKSLDGEDIKLNEAAGGVLANLALSHSNHSIMVGAGVIPKLAKILRNDIEGSKVVRKEARNALLELCKDDYYRILIVEEGLVPVPMIGSAAYESFRPGLHSWPSLPDGMEVQQTYKTPSRFGASELLLGLNVDDKNADIEEAKMNAIVGRTQQQFLARIGAIELEEEKKPSESTTGRQLTILPWMDGVARLVLILGLEDESAIARAAESIADASINEHIRIAFKETGAVKPLVQLLDSKNDVVVHAVSSTIPSSCVARRSRVGYALYFLAEMVQSTVIVDLEHMGVRDKGGGRMGFAAIPCQYFVVCQIIQRTRGTLIPSPMTVHNGVLVDSATKYLEMAECSQWFELWGAFEAGRNGSRRLRYQTFQQSSLSDISKYQNVIRSTQEVGELVVCVMMCGNQWGQISFITLFLDGDFVLVRRNTDGIWIFVFLDEGIASHMPKLAEDLALVLSATKLEKGSNGYAIAHMKMLRGVSKLGIYLGIEGDQWSNWMGDHCCNNHGAATTTLVQ